MEEGKKHYSDSDLEVFFKAARSDPPPDCGAYMERVLSDAVILQAPSNQSAATQAKAQLTISGLFESIMGWRGLAALTACICAGLWFGYAVPESYQTLTGAQTVALDETDGEYLLVFGLDDLLLEG